MCVLLCANRSVHEWLDIPLARAHRQVFQQCTLSPVDPEAEPNVVAAPLDDEAATRVMNRSAWIQAYFTRVTHSADSAESRHKTFDVLANAWGRLLSLVGLR